MNDLTILYYTANTIPEMTAVRVRNYLSKITENKFPIVSVSQKPLNFGQNICVGPIGRSKYNCYKQILTGVKEVTTKYVACAEDDTLYGADHFNYRPEDDGVFSYETNMWFAEESLFWRMEDINYRSGMWGCIAATKNLLNNLTTRYTQYPEDPLPKRNKYLYWCEPGTHDQLYGMQNRLVRFHSQNPTIVFRYKESMGGLRIGNNNVRTPENIRYNLEPFGGIKKFWKSYWS